MPKRNVYIISGTEHEYLNKWLLRTGKVKIRKHKNIPDVLLNEYEAHLLENNKHYPTNTSAQRLKVITDYIDYIVNVERDYKILLKLHNLKGWQIGQMLGYKSSCTWHKSYKRYTYIRFLVTMINKHEEVLNRLNNPKR